MCVLLAADEAPDDDPDVDGVAIMARVWPEDSTIIALDADNVQGCGFGWGATRFCMDEFRSCRRPG